MHSLKNFDKSYTKTFSGLLLSQEIHLLAPLSLLIRPNDRFPKPFHALQLEISQLPFQFLKPEKSKPFREEHRSIGRYKEYPPLPPPPWEFACARISGGTSRDKESPLFPTPTPTGFSYQFSRFLHNFVGKSSKQLTVQNL